MRVMVKPRRAPASVAVEWRESACEPAMGALTIRTRDGDETAHDLVSRDTAQRVADRRGVPLLIELA
jgi:hypothetical protein